MFQKSILHENLILYQNVFYQDIALQEKHYLCNKYRIISRNETHLLEHMMVHKSDGRYCLSNLRDQFLLQTHITCYP